MTEFYRLKCFHSQSRSGVQLMGGEGDILGFNGRGSQLLKFRADITNFKSEMLVHQVRIGGRRLTRASRRRRRWRRYKRQLLRICSFVESPRGEEAEVKF